MPILDKLKTKEYILTGLLAAFVLATVLFPIRDLDQITTLGNEIQYWGGAMSILGQDWSKYMDSQAMVSYGYSLILVPICMIFKDPTFAYKAAIILNGCFLALAYLWSVKVGKKLLKEENAYMAIIGCFLIQLLPIYAEYRVTVGPGSLMILLFWICVDMICRIQKTEDNVSLCILGACLVFLSWLDITTTVIFIGTVIYLYLCSKKGRLKEERFLKWLLLVLVGICVGYFTEQIFLYHVFDKAGVSYSGSIQVFTDRILSNWSEEGLMGFFFALIGKLYTVSVNTFCLFLPVLFAVIETVRSYKKEEMGELCPFIYMAFVGSVTFLMSALNWMGADVSAADEIWMFGATSIVVGPMLLLAVEKLLASVKWIEESIGYMTVFIVMTFIVSYVIKKASGTYEGAELGLLQFAYQSTESSQGMIYFSTVIALTVFLGVYALIKMKTRWVKMNQIFTLCATVCLLAVCTLFVSESVTFADEEQSEYTKYQKVSNVLNAMEEEIYCVNEETSFEDDLAVIQMLSNQAKIILVDEDSDINIEEKNIILTFVPYENVKNDLENHELIYLTNDVALWSANAAEAQDKVDSVLTKKEYNASRTQKGRTSYYGKDIFLSKGTYTARFYLTANMVSKETLGAFSVKTKNKVLQTKTLYAKDVIEGKNTIVELTFTDWEEMENIQFSFEKKGNNNITVNKVTYQKVNSEYSFGVNNQEEYQEILDKIEELNALAGKDGTIVYLDENATSKDIQKADYAISSEKLYNFYSVSDTHTILYRNRYFMLMSKADSIYDKAAKECHGYQGSSKNKIDLRTFMEVSADGSYDYSKPFRLESGDYNYVLQLKLESNKENRNYLGAFYVRNGTNRLTVEKLFAKRFGEDGVFELTIPLALLKNMNVFHSKMLLKDGVQVEILGGYIEMNRARYALGMEELGIKNFANIINASDENANVSFMMYESLQKNVEYSTEYLEELMPGCNIEVNTYAELMKVKEDRFVITKEYEKEFFKFVSKYTIIGQEGEYLLWARNDGGYLAEAVKHGAIVYSQGNKISAELLANVQGQEFDGSVSGLMSGTYRFYIEVEIANAVEDDTIEVGLVRDKTEDELAEERETLVASGYLEEDIEGLIEKKKYTTMTEFDISGKMKKGLRIVHHQMHCDSEYSNILAMCYSWKGSDVSASLIWIELIQ